MRLVIDNIAADKSADFIQLANQLKTAIRIEEVTEEDEDMLILHALESAQDDDVASEDEFRVFYDSLGK